MRHNHNGRLKGMGGQVDLISIIVSTYNWPRALAVVLDALSVQTTNQFEVIIADDGSEPATGELIAGRAADYPVDLRHVRQEDRGFRAGAARNRAVAESRGDYLLFLDGDCAVRPDFVATHGKLAEPGCFVAGNRILLNKTLTEAVLSGTEKVFLWSVPRFFQNRLRGEVNRVLPLLHLPGGFWRKLRPSRWQGAMTCNLAVFRDDFYRVNGFDEDFVGWGHEDAEFAGRLINAGVFRKEGRFAVPVLHLWHQSQDRSREEENLRRLHEQLARKATWAGNGIDKYTV